MTYTANDRERKKEYYLENKDKILEYNKQYKDTNRESINLKASEKIMCECGCELRRDKMTKHQTTRKHQNLLNEKL